MFIRNSAFSKEREEGKNNNHRGYGMPIINNDIQRNTRENKPFICEYDMKDAMY